MSPTEQLAELYAKYAPHRVMSEDILTYIRLHYIIATPHFIAMGKPVIRGAPEKDIIDPEFVFPVGEIDTWFLFAFCGSYIDFLSYVPFDLQWIAWERKGSGLRYYCLSHFRKVWKRCSHAFGRK